MRIAIDARAYSWAGIGRYTRNLLRGLLRVKSDHEFVVLLGDRDTEQFGQDMRREGIKVPDTVVVDSSYYSWREQVVFLRQLYRLKVDLVHFTNFNVPLLFGRPYVVTVHDTTRFIFPGQTAQSLLKQVAYERVFGHAVTMARGIICVSQATRWELEQLPLRLPKCVRVVHEGVDEVFKRQISRQERQQARLLLGFTDPYLLYVGVWMSHKNLPRLLAAYSQLLERYPHVKLVMTGRPKPGYVGVTQLARSLGLTSEQVIYLGQVSADVLPALYAEATCLLLPSLYEGFGLPVLEAAACGTPVVASQVSSLPEVLGEAAELVNPEYVPGIVFGIEQVLADRAKRQELIERGRRRALAFSWDRSVRETLAVYGQATLQ